MYSKRVLRNYNYKKNLYLVDLAKEILENKNFRTINTKIKIRKRKDKPRVGSTISVNIKLIKIINFLIFN